MHRIGSPEDTDINELDGNMGVHHTPDHNLSKVVSSYPKKSSGEQVRTVGIAIA